MAYDGAPYGNRVDHTTDRKLYQKVTDSVLNSSTYFARVLGQGRAMTGKTEDFTLKISDSASGGFFVGMETLSSAASDTTVQLSFAQTNFEQAIVIPLAEAMANSGSTQVIPLGAFKTEEAQAEVINRLGSAIFSTGSGNSFLGLEGIVDDGTNNATIGGASRSTYTNLKGTVTASGGTFSLAKAATLDDTVSASGSETESPNIYVTSKSIWSNLESLYSPQVRASYNEVGYNMLPVRGDSIVKRAELKGGAGFTALTFRGNPVIKDDKCTTGVWYALNERYNQWVGRNVVPEDFAEEIERLTLPEPKTMDGVFGGIPNTYGFFMQKKRMLPTQAGLLGRIYVFGQFVTRQPRRNGKLTGITGI